MISYNIKGMRLQGELLDNLIKHLQNNQMDSGPDVVKILKVVTTLIMQFYNTEVQTLMLFLT